MKRSLLYIMGVVCLMTSCAEESFEPVTPTPGKDVVFAIGAKSNPITRTLYGPEVSGTDSDSYADSTQIYWVHGDAISVYGASCLAGRKQAEYAVSTAELDENGNETSVINTTQNYASLLKKTGDTGVQWGNTGTSNFYALYPSSNAVSFDDNGVIKASISATQNYVFELGSNTTTVTENDTKHTVQIWEGSHFGSDATNPSMQNAIMFARTENASSSDDAVNLHFKPFATVLKMRFLGFLSSLSTDTKAYVQSITITAPYAIAGDFTFETSGSLDKAAAVVTSSENTSNSITVNTILPGGGFLPLENLQAVEFNVFTIPSEGVKMSATDLWTVSVQVQGYQPFTYQMKPKTDGAEYTLEPAKIHKVQIPQYTSLTSEPWDPAVWISQIPTPVYISELSMPGAWYAGDLTNYQGGKTLTELYTAGVRAFHIDCRMSPSSFNVDFWLNKTYGALELVCAGTDKWGTGGPTAANIAYNPFVRGTQVLTALSEIAKNIPNNEYVVVVLTIAEKPLTSSGTAYGGATVDPAVVIPAIKSVIDANGAALKVFGYYDSENGIIKTKGKTITKDTTIEDVLGTMIIKINTNTDAISSYSFPSSSLISFGSMASDGDYNTSDDVITDLPYDYFAKMQIAPMYWANNTTSELTYYYHQAQMTTIDETNNATETDPIPTLKDRKTAISEIISKSKGIYDAGDHNAWFQIGIGGYKEGDADDKSSVTSSLATYLQTEIENKLESDPSPVGIVLMNNCLDYTELIQDIIEMNGKFYLNRVGGTIVTDGSSDNGTPKSNAAYALVGDDAF